MNQMMNYYVDHIIYKKNTIKTVEEIVNSGQQQINKYIDSMKRGFASTKASDDRISVEIEGSIIGGF